MKAIFYCTAITLVAISAGSCSKKNNDSDQQLQNGQKELSAAEGKDQEAKLQVNSVPNQDVLVLNAEETVQILRAAGFSDSQIQEHGYSIREALAKTGAVRILVDNVVEAGFAVKGEDVYISSRTRGLFIYNINTGLAGQNR